MNITHVLKIQQEYFLAILTGNKKAEFRKDDGRDFRCGELIRLREFIWLHIDSPKGDSLARELVYTSRELIVCITDVTIVNAIYEEIPDSPKFVMLSFDVLSMTDFKRGVVIL
ncbi:DUF3850 domain-containing protein [Providencia rettgeri]|nr:DUF3850 domain-containing protein [Providencia rettgeri]